MLEFVEHLFTYQFLNRALITSIIVGIICGTVGSLIVLRGLSLWIMNVTNINLRCPITLFGIPCL